MTAISLPDHLAGAFARQQEACRTLGSPFNALLCQAVVRYGLPESRTRSTLVDWQGDPTGAGDALPVRLCGALHELVLTEAESGLGGLYPPNHHTVNAATLHKAITAAITTHDRFIATRLRMAPQTNEVRRSTAIIATLLHIAARTNLPLQISEIGASAGLNLRLDRFAHVICGKTYGAADSPLRLEPDWSGPPPPEAGLRIDDRRGCDLSPLDLDHDGDRTRLLSYVWPDQPDRLERLRAAMGIADAVPVRVDRKDAIAWLEARLREPRNGRAHVLYHTIAWQYLPEDAKRLGRNIIEKAGARATPSAPLFLLGMEPDGQSPGAALRLDAWPDGTSVELARVDFHGRWVRWREPD